MKRPGRSGRTAVIEAGAGSRRGGLSTSTCPQGGPARRLPHTASQRRDRSGNRSSSRGCAGATAIRETGRDGGVRDGLRRGRGRRQRLHRDARTAVEILDTGAGRGVVLRAGRGASRCRWDPT